MAYWLFKSEPNTYSIDDFAADRSDWWDGIRNYQARNFMRDAMQVGDGVLFYHSSCPQPAVVGVAQVSRPAKPDASQYDREHPYYDPRVPADKPRWWYVQITFVGKFSKAVALSALRQHPDLADMHILRRGNRLSITPVSESEWNIINALGG